MNDRAEDELEKLVENGDTLDGTMTIPINIEEMTESSNITPILETKQQNSAVNMQANTIAYISVLGAGLCAFSFPLVVSTLKLAIGWRHVDECPVNPRIPHYMMVAGAVGLVRTGIRIVHISIKTRSIDLSGTSNSENTPTGSLWFSRIYPVVSFNLDVFLIGWFISGFISVFSVRNKVQFYDPSLSSYCHPTLYRFASWSLLPSFIHRLLSACKIVLKLYLSKKTMEKKKAKTL